MALLAGEVHFFSSCFATDPRNFLAWLDGEVTGSSLALTDGEATMTFSTTGSFTTTFLASMEGEVAETSSTSGSLPTIFLALFLGEVATGCLSSSGSFGTIFLTSSSSGSFRTREVVVTETFSTIDSWLTWALSEDVAARNALATEAGDEES